MPIQPPRQDRFNLVHPFDMIDIETIGVDVNATIVEIGISHFTGNVQSGNADDGKFITKSEYIKVDWQRANPETLEWWRKQSYWPTLLEKIEDHTQHCWHVDHALELLMYQFESEDIVPNATRPIYALGPQFDIAMLTHQSVFEKNIFWNFRKVRDLRTTFDDLNHGTRPQIIMDGMMKHSAGKDAEMQARQLVSIQQRTSVHTMLNEPSTLML